MIAVLVIALFYTEEIRWVGLLTTVVFVVLIVIFGRLGVRPMWIYFVLACGVWLGVLISGVHATIAGVIIAMVVPVRSRIEPSAYLQRLRGGLGLLEQSELTRDSVVSNAEQQKALGRIYFATDDMMPVGLRFEKQLHPMQAFLILPLFALFSAGVKFDAETLADASGAVGWGIVIGLFVGKQIGVTLAGWLVIRSGRADMPEGVTWSQLWGVSCLAGIGFTMSIFITGLAFSDATLISEAKIGILAGSLLSGIAGYVVLRKALPKY
jgi:NhaA family Na+:H+ antiporter